MFNRRKQLDLEMTSQQVRNDVYEKQMRILKIGAYIFSFIGLCLLVLVAYGALGMFGVIK